SIVDGTGAQAEFGSVDLAVLQPESFSTQAAGGVVTISGAGNGHGVGMSQWGAQGRALAGQDYRQILAAYYQGTTVSQDPSNEPLWVNLEDELVKVQLKFRENVAGGAPVTVKRDDTGAYAGILKEAVLAPGDTLVVQYLDRSGPVVAPVKNPRRCTKHIQPLWIDREDPLSPGMPAG
ncbi:MAG: hypothetical protein MUP13_17960, partial [Thermoanaerobaculales bacterium]|nr:hypothetical protein [Thermoanaerobaculales bacterium]